MTPYKITTLFLLHREYTAYGYWKPKQKGAKLKPVGDIDAAINALGI